MPLCRRIYPLVHLASSSSSLILFAPSAARSSSAAAAVFGLHRPVRAMTTTTTPAQRTRSPESPPDLPSPKRTRADYIDSEMPIASTSAAALSSNVIQNGSETPTIAAQFPWPEPPSHFHKVVASKEKSRKATLEKTGEEPIYFDIVDLLGKSTVHDVLARDGGGQEWADRFPRDTIIEGKVEKLTSNGVGLIVAPTKDWILAVPTVLPGERVRVRVDRSERMFSKCDLVEIIEKSPQRRDDLVGCKYFGECPGCQYQMLPYEEQLRLKQNVVKNAFAHYSGLEASEIPETLPTLPSPIQYAYRTKLTPHFNLPRRLDEFMRTHGHSSRWKSKGRKGSGRSRKAIEGLSQEEMEEMSQIAAKELKIGFEHLKRGGKDILDIEECPIATSVINEALPVEKGRVAETISSFRAGATLLLRDSLTPKAFGLTEAEAEKDPVKTRDGKSVPAQSGDSEVITSFRAIARDRVDEVRFQTPSNSFFQNNRAILPSLISYIREAIVNARTGVPDSQDYCLVDTYCGSGLFALSLAPLFKKVAGVEISKESIEFAKQNAKVNGVEDKVEFLAGNAEDIFGTLDESYPSDQTTVVIDPPRRGCDQAFITQLVRLSPSLIVYVSCNVHTQARDVGMFIKQARQGGMAGAAAGVGVEYEIVSVKGADLFPQTYHVEGICVLRKKASNSAADINEGATTSSTIGSNPAGLAKTMISLEE